MTATLDDLLGGRMHLASALAGTQAADAEKARVLHDAVVTALRVVDAVAEDDELWARLRGTAGELRIEDVPRLGVLVDRQLAPLLTAFGYEQPPPPPVHELVDTTAALLAHAVVAVGDPLRAQYDVDIARTAVRRFVARAREQVLTAAPPERRPLRAWARRVRRMVERLVPPVAGAGAAGLVVAAFGGAEGGIAGGAAYKSVEELVKQLVELGAAYAVGWGEEVVAATPVPSLPPGGLRLTELELLAESFGAGVAGWLAGRGGAAAARPGSRSFGDALPPAVRAELDEVEVALEGFADAFDPVGAGVLAPEVDGVREALHALRRHVPRPDVLSPGPAEPDALGLATAALLTRVRGLRARLDAAVG